MELEKQIIEFDGSCRDINFPDVDKFKAIALLEHIKSFSILECADDEDGNEVSADEIKNLLSSSSRKTIFSFWKSEGLISGIQLFFLWANQSEIFIELTFKPDHINQKLFNINEFLNWLKPILAALNTKEYYVRYENASWEYGDIGEDSLVIFSNAQYPIND